MGKFIPRKWRSLDTDKCFKKEGKIGTEIVLGLVVKVTPSAEIAQERLSKNKVLPHIVESQRKS